MKRLLACILLLAGLLIGAFFWQGHVREHVQALVTMTEQAQQALDEGDFDTVRAQLKQIDDAWDHVRDHWAMLIDHQTLDQVDETLASSQNLAKAEDAVLCDLELTRLELGIQATVDDYAFSLKNLF